MDGLMQNVPLTVDRIIGHAAAWHGAREIVSRDAEGRVTRTAYAAVRADAKRVSNALAVEGIAPGDLRTFLDDKIARWWMPDDALFVDAIPLGSTGKIDKRAIRAGLDGYTLPFEVSR